MPSSFEPKLPAAFPWITYGRPESGAELLSQWRIERASAAYLPVDFRLTWISIPSERSIASDVRRGAVEGQSLAVEWIRPETENDRSDPIAFANRAVERARGTWIGFLDEATLPSPSAAFQLLREAHTVSGAELVSANEALLDSISQLRGWIARPQWSPLTLAQGNYLGSSWILKRDRFLSLGGLGSGGWETALHELLARGAERGLKAASTSAVLFYRLGEPAAGSPLRTLDWARPIEKEVEGRSRTCLLPIEPERPRVSVVVAFRDRAEWTCRCLEALAGQQGVDVEVVLVDNESVPTEREAIRAQAGRLGLAYQWLYFPGPFHFARMNNEAVRRCAGRDLILLLNNDVFLHQPDTVLAMARWASRPEAGTVGIHLTYPDGRPQHEGIRATEGTRGRLVLVGHFPTGDRFSRESREVFGNTFAACCFRREVFDRAGGLSELAWVNGFGDVAFQLEVIRQGYHHFYLGPWQAVHLESGSRGMASYEFWEEKNLERHYGAELTRMVHADLAWHEPPKLLRRWLRGTLDSAREALRTSAPELLGTAKRGLNALRERFKMGST